MVHIAVLENKGYETWDDIQRDFNVKPEELTRGMIAEAIMHDIDHVFPFTRVAGPLMWTDYDYVFPPLKKRKHGQYSRITRVDWRVYYSLDYKPHGVLELRSRLEQRATFPGGDTRMLRHCTYEASTERVQIYVRTRNPTHDFTTALERRYPFMKFMDDASGKDMLHPAIPAYPHSRPELKIWRHDEPQPDDDESQSDYWESESQYYDPWESESEHYDPEPDD
ncbi:MAG: hypothetical protein AB1486_18645 [Planctomycetota bacterium]